jgi:hypothetical protein
MEEIIAEEKGTELVPASLPGADSSVPSEAEQKLADEIKQLWADHTEAQATVRQSREEIRLVRQRLSESLSLMKERLVEPGCTGGRNGRWASFLRSQKIATATADRLVRAYRSSMDLQPNLVTDHVSEPDEGGVERLFTLLLPKLRMILTTRQAAHEFVLLIVKTFEVPCETQDNGTLVLDLQIEILKEPSSVAEHVSAEQSVAVADAGSNLM